MAQENYWTKKDNVLFELAEERGIPFDKDNFNRKELCDALKQWDVEKGDFDSALEETDDGLKEVEVETIPTTKVIFHNTNPETDMPYVFVGHNGRAWYLPKDKELFVPNFILDSCIKDAVEERLIPEFDARGNINWVKKPVHRFPYSVVPTT